MNEPAVPSVRFVCADGHPDRELGRWGLAADGLAVRVDLADLADGQAAVGMFMRAAHRNAAYIDRAQAQGNRRALATFDERCGRCGHEPSQVNAERFTRFLAGLIAAGVDQLDVSKVDMSTVGR